MENITKLWKKWKVILLNTKEKGEEKYEIKKEELKEGLKKKLRRFFLSFDLIHYLATKKKNLKEYKKIQRKNAMIAVDSILKGLGGDKNLVKIKNTSYSIQITFKSDYFLDRELLLKSGGLDMRIVDNCLYSIFDKKETKWISQKIKQIIKDARRKYKRVNID